MADRDDVELMGFPVSRVTLDGVAERIVASLERGEGGWVFTPNLDILRQLSSRPEYAAMCREATIRTADGMPLVWASRLRGTPLPMRVSGSDLIWRVSAAAARSGRRVYFFGGDPGAAEACVERLRAESPGLVVAGIECPPMGFEKDLAYMSAWRDRLRTSAAEIVFVALSSPKQDHVIDAVRRDFPGVWFLGVGISFSFVAGRVKRAPMAVRRLGLEWAHRLVQEPRKLAKRYLVLGLPFAVRLLGSAVAARWRRTGRAGRRTPPIQPS